MALCGDIENLNIDRSKTNYDNYKAYVDKKKDLYNLWFRYFNDYKEGVGGVSEHIIQTLRQQYRDLVEPTVIPLENTSACKSDDSIFFNQTNVVVNPIKMTNFNLYNNVGFGTDPQSVYEMDSTACQRSCINDINCMAFTHGSDGLCNLYNSIPLPFVAKDNTKLFIKREGVLPGAEPESILLESISNEAIAGIVVGVIFLLIIIALGIFFLFMN